MIQRASLKDSRRASVLCWFLELFRANLGASFPENRRFRYVVLRKAKPGTAGSLHDACSACVHCGSCHVQYECCMPCCARACESHERPAEPLPPARMQAIKLAAMPQRVPSRRCRRVRTHATHAHNARTHRSHTTLARRTHMRDTRTDAHMSICAYKYTTHIARRLRRSDTLGATLSQTVRRIRCDAATL